MLPESDPHIFEESLKAGLGRQQEPTSAILCFGCRLRPGASKSLDESLWSTIWYHPQSTCPYQIFPHCREPARLSKDAKEMSGTTRRKKVTIITLYPASVISREEKNLEKLVTTLENFTNPFIEQSNDLFNLVTKFVTPSKVKKDLLEQSEIGQNLFEKFVKDRIQSGEINLWSLMK